MKQGNNRGQPRKRGRKSKVEKAMEAQQKQAEEKQEPKEESEESIAKPKTKKIHHNTLKAMERKRKAEEERLRKLAENGNSSQSKEEEKRIVKQQRRGKKKKKNVEESQPKCPEDHAKMEAQVKSQPQSQPAPAQEIPQPSISQQPVKKPDRIVKNIQPQSLVNYNKYYDDIFDVLKPIDEVNEQYLIFDRSKPSVYNELVGKIKKHCAVPSCDVFHDS